jgi:UDP-MurNAc hydroxylase
MRITNIGGATAILEHAGKRMLFDPWLDDGIFHGAWYHFPPLGVSIADLGRFDYIYISHIHEDHCSAGTIRHLNQDAEIILMDRQPNFVLRFLDSHGFRFRKIHLVKPRSEVRLDADLQVNVLEADPGHELAYVIDSSLLLRWGGFTVYNANDCQPYDDGLQYVTATYGRLDLALIPYAGGSGYPSCYANLSDDEKRHEKERILNSRLETFRRTVKRLDPRYVMPFADQYVVWGSRAELNRFISHPACPGIVRERLAADGLDDRLLLLNSGQSFDLGTRRKSPEGDYRMFSEADRERYVDAKLRDKLYDHERIQFTPSVAVDRLVSAARGRLWAIQSRKREFPAYSIYLETTDTRRRFRIRLDLEATEEVGWTAPLDPPYLKVSCTHTLMVMLLIGHVSWNIADAALFLDYERVPNVYDPRIYVHLNYLKA